MFYDIRYRVFYNEKTKAYPINFDKLIKTINFNEVPK